MCVVCGVCACVCGGASFSVSVGSQAPGEQLASLQSRGMSVVYFRNVNVFRFQ